jgi:hypothetical protein
MTKETIIERLLEQGHITVRWAEAILNKKPNHIRKVIELSEDGVISYSEVICLFNEKPTQSTLSSPAWEPNKFPTFAPPYEPGKPYWQCPEIYCGTTPVDPCNTTTCNTTEYPKSTIVTNTEQFGNTTNIKK